MTRRHGKKRWSFLAFILVITLICGSISVSAAPESEDAGSVETATEVVTEQSTPVVEPEPSVSYESVTVEEQPEEPAQEEAEPEASVEESVAEDSEPEITSDADSEETASDSEDPAEEAEEEAEDTESEDAESEDAESEEEAEEAETVSYPAQTFSGRAGGVSVSVSADADVFPEGTTMVVSAVSKNTAMSVAEDASDDNSEVVDAAGVDISFRDADGNEIEPKDEKNVHVSLSLSSALDGESFSVIHYADNGDVETVTEQATASGASFSASAFSIYIISGENPPIATYVFYDADGNEISTQKVKDGEILYSPETPEKDGFIFIGWAESEGADEADTDAFASRTANVSETETIRYYPVYEEAHYVFFMDNQGRVSTTKQGASGDVISTTDVTIPLDSTHSVVGWYYDEDLTEAAEDTITLGTEDITLYPEVEEGHYLYFATGSNATYIAPEFIAADAVTAEPEAPARSGYNFVGWASTSDAATADFVFGNELDANTTIYAVWEARTDVKYTVLYWTENADDEEYSFVSSESRTGTAGQTVNLGSVSTSVLGSESGYFTYDASKSDTDVVVKGDGTTIVNVYFSRNTYTLTFQVRSGFGRRTVATITAKYNAAIADRFNEAPFTTTYNGRAWQDTGSTYSYALQTLDRMPGTNVTFHLYDKSSDTKKTIYYYVQNVDSTLTTWPSTNQVSANYTLLKSVDTYFNFATYNEEYHEIAGFTRFSRSAAGFNGNSRKYFSNNTLYLYYLRNSYNLEFVSGGETVKTESVKYEASLTDLLSYVPDRPNNVPEEFVFRGWYMSSECLDGTEVTLTSMPANNVRVYAKWAPDPVDNIAYLTINGDGGKKTVEVVYGEVINQSDLPSVQDADGNVIRQGDDAYIVTVPEGYEWSGWATKTASGTYVIFNFDTVIQTSVELYPYYISTTRFTVSYDLGNGTGSVVDVKQYAENAEADVKEFTGTAPEGKVFLYWTDGTNNYYPQDKVTITENLTLTAVYGEIPETVTLTYKSAYPDGTEDVTYEVEEDGSTALANNSSFTVLTLAAAGMTEPEGYYFAGWENNGTVYQPDETIGVDWNDPDENVLTAKWGKKKEITLVANSGEYTYDGTEHSAVGVETDTFVIDGETYTVSGYTTENPSATNAGSSTNAISIKDAVVIDEDGRDVTYQFTIHTEDGSLVISPRSVILTSATDSKKYDGTALTNENVTVTGDGFVEGEGAEYDVTGTQTEVGRSQNKFTYELNDGTSARNYEIQTVFGNLEVYKQDGVVVYIAENGRVVTYNGTEQSLTGYEVIAIQVGDEATEIYTESDFTFDGDATAKGTGVGTYEMELKASDFTNTNTNFENVTFVIVDGALEITPKPITLSTETKSWEYDGEEHSAPEVNGTDGFYDRDGITATATETVKNAGDSKTNTITVTGDTKNYDIVKDEGTISVYARDGVVVTITENSDTVVYNGEEQSVTGYTVTSIQIGSEATDLYTAADFTFSGDATAKGTDAGTYDMGLKASDFTNTNTNFENVTFVIVDGTLTITQKPITLSTDTQSWEYDGEEHSAPTVSGTEGFYDRDGITATATETVQNAGDRKTNAITVTGDTKNYEIVKDEGTISVYAKDGVVVTITENSDSKVYNGEEQSVTGYTVTSIQVGSEATDLYTAADFTFSGDATAKGTDAGTYDMELKVSDFTNTNTNFENVTFVIVDGTLEITQKPITLSTDTQSWEYDGEEHSAPEVSGTEDFYSRDGITVTATETVKNAGETKTNTITVTGDTKNYTVTKNEGTISIYAQDGVVVTITENSDTVKYNGEEQSVSGYTVTSIQIGSEVTDLYTEADFSFSGDAAAKGTNAGIYDMELTASDFTNTNDNFTNVQFVIVDGSLEISKRVVVLTSATDSKQYDGKALTNDTITVSGDGFAKGEGAVYDVTGSQTVVGSSWNTFTYTLFDAEDQTLLDKIAGLFGDKPSKTTSADNYSITTAEGTLTVTNRDAKYEVTLVANSGTYTYDGTEKTAAGIETDTFEVDGNTYTVSGYQTEDPAETNAGTYTNNITGTYVVQDEEGNDVTDQFSVRTENGSLTIQKKDVTLTSATDTKEYDGTALTNDTVTAVGFVEGEGASYNVTGSQTIVGSSSNTFTYTLQEGTLADNYNITKTEGTLTVTNRTAKYEVTLTANSGTYTYDGTQHTAAGVETDIFEIAGNTYTVSGYQTEDPAETDAGTYTNNITGTYVVRDADSNDVTEQFTVKTENGTLEILKRALTLTSATDYKEYDGKALTNSKITVSGDGFVSGDGASYSVTGSQKLPGTSENTFTYTLNSGTKADNYNITTSFGTLTVTNRDAQYEITLIANSAFATYDGKSHTAAGVTTDLFVVDGETYTVSGYQTSDPSEVNAGSYENNITGTFVVTDADGNDVTEQFAVTVVNGSLEIAKRDIILKSADLSKEYDGKALTNGDTALAIEEGFVDGEGAVYLFTGSQKIPGASSNSFSYTLNEGTDAGNYNITKTEGTLTVTNREAQFEVTLVANSGTFTYDGESHAATGVETDTFTIDGETYTVSGYTTEDPNETNASVYTNNITGTFTVTDADGNDVTSEFKVNTENGTLVINKREVTLTSGSAQKSYDGTPLTNDEITIGGDGFAEGEGANYTLTGSQTLVGSSENTFTYTLYPESSGGSIRKTLAENYNIKTANGTLTVTDEDIPSETVITKTDDGKIYAVGDTITFTITVRNIYDTAQTITIREQSGVTITGDSVFADVAPGAEISTTAEHVVTLADIEAGTYTNRAEADFSGGKTYEGEDTVDEFAHASVNKEAISTPANGAAYALGETVSYQITVTNEGTVDLTDLTVTDSLTGDTWTIAHLAAGKSQIFTTDYVVTEADVLAGKIHNEATVDVTNPGGDDPVPVDPGEEDVPTVTPKSSLYVEKISDAEGTVKLGESITYTIKVLNNGNVTISDVEVVDEMTGDVWTVEKLSPLESATFTTEHVVTEQDIVKGKVLNIATATGKDPNGNEPDTTPGIAENETEPESAHLTLTKTTTSSPKDESGYVTGEKITYEITVLNDGNQTVKNIVVTDELTDDEWSIGDLKPGEMQTLHAEYTVTAADAKAGFVRNVAAAVGDSDGDEDVIVTPGTTEDPVQKDTETPKDTKDPKPGKTVKGSHAKAIKTGDTSNAVLWVIVLVLAAAVVLLMSYRRRNRKDTGSKQ